MHANCRTLALLLVVVVVMGVVAVVLVGVEVANSHEAVPPALLLDWCGCCNY